MKFAKFSSVRLTIGVFIALVLLVESFSNARASSSSLEFQGRITASGGFGVNFGADTLNVMGNKAAAPLVMQNPSNGPIQIQFVIADKGQKLISSNSTAVQFIVEAKAYQKGLLEFDLNSQVDQTRRICFASRAQNSGWSEYRCRTLRIIRMDLLN